MARAAGSNTKFASVNLNKSYGKPATGGAGSGNGSGSGSGALGSAGRAARTSSSHGGMLLLSRPGATGAAVQKGGKVIVPRPVNLPSLRREHSGNDPSIALVSGSGASGWTKAPVQEEAPVPATTSETTGRFIRHVQTFVAFPFCLMLEPPFLRTWIWLDSDSNSVFLSFGLLLSLNGIYAFSLVCGLHPCGSGYEL